MLRDGEPLPLTRLEFDLLLHLVAHPRRVFTRLQLLNAVWGYEHAGVRTVDVHVRRLRGKVGVDVPLVTTVYGVGYRLADDARVTIDRTRLTGAPRRARRGAGWSGAHPSHLARPARHRADRAGWSTPPPRAGPAPAAGGRGRRPRRRPRTSWPTRWSTRCAPAAGRCCTCAPTDFLRPASVRLELGRTNPDAYYEGWVDEAGAAPGGARPGRPGRHRAGAARRSGTPPPTGPAAAATSTCRPAGSSWSAGRCCSAAGCPSTSPSTSSCRRRRWRRRTDPALRWTLPAFARYAEEVAPAGFADVVVRADDPRHPALVEPAQPG